MTKFGQTYFFLKIHRVTMILAKNCQILPIFVHFEGGFRSPGVQKWTNFDRFWTNIWPKMANFQIFTAILTYLTWCEPKNETNLAKKNLGATVYLSRKI